MAEGMIKQAINNLETKYIPQSAKITVFIPEEAYRKLFPFLDIWGAEVEDSKTQDHVKYIYNKLIDINRINPSGELISVLTELGSVNFGESKLDKVYKYFHLMDESSKALKYHNLLVGEIESMKNKDDKKDGEEQ